MNKQEFIERIKSLKNIFGNKCEYIKIDAVIELASELDEPQKVAVPQFVADWIEKCKVIKKFKASLAYALNSEVWSENNLSDECIDWLYNANNQEIFARAWLDGYEVEEEKRYLVKLKGIKSSECYLNCVGNAKNWIVADKTEHAHILTKHTRKELEEAGFGEVFNSPLFEVEEVAE